MKEKISLPQVCFFPWFLFERGTSSVEKFLFLLEESKMFFPQGSDSGKIPGKSESGKGSGPGEVG